MATTRKKATPVSQSEPEEMPIESRDMLPRNPDGRINNCAIACVTIESECQMCKGICPDKQKFESGGAFSTTPIIGRRTEESGSDIEADGERVIVQEQSVTQEVANGDVKRGTVVVRSQLDKLDPTFRSREIEVEAFVTQPAIVSRSFEAVILGVDGYPRGKTSVFVSWPCYREEFQDAMTLVRKVAKEELRVELASAKEKLDRVKSKPNSGRL
jgi:hypothetical protein